MRQRAGLVVVAASMGVACGFSGLRAEGEGSAEGSAEQAEQHHEAAPVEAEQHHEAAPVEAQAADSDDDDDAAAANVPYNKFDLDGDGKADPAVEKEYDDAMEGISATIDTDVVDKELEARPADQEMKPSMTVDEFRKVVRIVKKVVLGRMEKKMAKSSAKKMRQF